MLKFQLLQFLLFCLHYGRSEGSCATQAIFLFVHARTAMILVNHAQTEVHCNLLILLHGTAACLAVPHPAFLHPPALTLPLYFSSILIFQNIFPVCQDRFWNLISFPSIVTAFPQTEHACCLYHYPHHWCQTSMVWLNEPLCFLCWQLRTV